MKNLILRLTHEVVFIDGNPHGGPDRVTYGSLASARRSAKQETDRGIRTEVRTCPPFTFDENGRIQIRPLGQLC